MEENTPIAQSASPPKTIYITYVDKIDLVRVKNLIAIVSSIVSGEKPDELYFLISSGGGEVDAGIALYNFLNALPVKITMHNIGSIDSIANVIFMAGNRHFANPHTTFLFHGVVMNLNGPVTLALPNVKEMMDRIEKNHDTIANIVCGKTSMKEETIKNLFAGGETKTADFALQVGIIDEIKVAEIPKDAPFVSVDING